MGLFRGICFAQVYRRFASFYLIEARQIDRFAKEVCERILQLEDDIQ